MKRATLADQAHFCREMSALLRLGFPLVEAVGRVRRTAPADLAEPMARMEADIRQGSSLGTAIENQRETFAPPLVRALRAAESGDRSEKMLADVGTLLEAAEYQRVATGLSLAYPRLALIVFGFLCVMLIVLVTGALPDHGLFSMFENMNIPLPLPTKIVLGIGRLFPPPVLLAVVVLGVVVGNVILSGRLSTGALRYRLPLLGRMLQRQDTSGWLSWMDYLLTNRVPLPEAIRTAAGGGSSTFGEWMEKVAKRVEMGSTLSQALVALGTMDDESIWLVERVEPQGFPPGSLAKAANILRCELEVGYQRGMGILEPIAIAILGAALGFIVIALFLPLYNLIGQLH